jgi:hypothetical protein
MSDFVALGAMVALGIANAFLTVFMNTWMAGIHHAIVSGGLPGGQVPVKDRRYRLQVPFVINSGALIAIEGVLAIGWLLIGGNAGASDLKLLAYLIAFLNAVNAIGWLATIPTHYRHLAAVLREAEAD